MEAVSFREAKLFGASEETMKWLLVFGLLFLSANVFAVTNFSSKKDVTPLVQPLNSLNSIANKPATVYEICNSQNKCAQIFAGLDAVNKQCVFQFIKWL